MWFVLRTWCISSRGHFEWNRPVVSEVKSRSDRVEMMACWIRSQRSIWMALKTEEVWNSQHLWVSLSDLATYVSLPWTWRIFNEVVGSPRSGCRIFCCRVTRRIPSASRRITIGRREFAYRLFRNWRLDKAQNIFHKHSSRSEPQSGHRETKGHWAALELSWRILIKFPPLNWTGWLVGCQLEFVH